MRIASLMALGLIWSQASGCLAKTDDKTKDIVEAELVEPTKPLVKEELNRPTVNIQANQVIQSPIDILVNSEGKWGGFEGELGTAELLDAHGDQLGICILSTKENWMVTGPVRYNCQLSFTASATTYGTLLVRNNNPTGLKEHDKSFEIPIRYSLTE